MRARHYVMGLGLALVALAIWQVIKLRDEAEQNEIAKAAVTVSARLSEECAGDHPILIRVGNGSARTLKSAGYRIAVFEPGRSDDLVSYGDRTWDVITQPHSYQEMCLRMPSLSREPPKVIVRATIDDVTFYGPAEFIPKRRDVAELPSARGSPSSSSTARASGPASN